LWKAPQQLAGRLGELVLAMPPHEAIAVTMTGELCDCFWSKAEGVRVILDAVAAASSPTSVHVWGAEGFVDIASARRNPLVIASANWLALATFAGRLLPTGNCMLIDIGSTTTDLVPIVSGRPSPRAFTDPERLRSLELVYTGVRRTPVCALLGVEVAAELFATTLDVYLVLGNLVENPADCATADGRPATTECAHARLARMICADPDTCPKGKTHDLARRAFLRQLHCLNSAFEQVAKNFAGAADAVLISGEGEFLARQMLEKQSHVRLLSLGKKLGPEVSQAACAYAAARLLAGTTE
jgi:probable H4MPT-linked C1 transfer pathway protein